MRALKLSLAFLALLLALPVAAQQQNLESKLRDQLRATALKLRELESQQAQLASAKTAAEQERDTLRAQLDAARAAAQGSDAKTSAALKAERAQRAQVEQALPKFKAAYEEAAIVARSSQADNAKLRAELEAKTATLQQCSAANVQLYDTGRQILSAYEKIGVGEVIMAREPFVGAKRVELENAAQSFGDKLYEGRFDPRATPAAAGPAQ